MSANVTPGPAADLDRRLEALGLAGNAAELALRGYTVIADAAPVELFDRLRSRILSCFARAGTPVLVGRLLEQDRAFEEAVCCEKLVALAEFLCGRGFLLSQLVGTVRGDGERGLRIHTDCNLVRDPFPPFPLVATAVWACDDFTEAGGCTRVVPRSHLLRRHPAAQLGEGDDQAVPVECPRGSILMWDGATWHGSCPRRIGGQRVTLHAMFNRMVLRTFERYDLPPEVLERNPPVLTTMLGMDDPFGKSTGAGVDLERTRRCAGIFRS